MYTPAEGTMFRVAVTITAVFAIAVIAIAPAAAQLGASALPVPSPVRAVTPMVSYVWYEPARDEVESGRGIEAAVLFNFAGPIKGRLQYIWPQTGDYSNIALSGVLGWGGPIYLGAGIERSSARENFPVPRDIDETQTYAFVGLASRNPLYSLLFEVERSFGSDLEGTTFKAGATVSW
jgi:hypothetical protein